MSGSEPKIVSAEDALEMLQMMQGFNLEVDRETLVHLNYTVVKVSEERDWLAKALQDQEEAYAALEASYLALTDAYTDLVDRLAALAPEVIAS